MPRRPRPPFQPRLDNLEARRPLTAGASALAASLAHQRPASPEGRDVTAERLEPKPSNGYLLYRITNPTLVNNHLIGPFGQVRLGPSQPVAGKTYNILFVTVRNGTNQTFTARDGFTVQYPGATPIPILSGDQTWAPGQQYVVYLLSQRYYPLPSQAHSGYIFNLGGAKSVAIPGPSGIFQRVKYDPTTFNQTLDRIVKYGPGNQGGIGVHFGLPNTSIYEFVPSTANRNDFSGYF